jgi:hypothetical protein
MMDFIARKIDCVLQFINDVFDIKTLNPKLYFGLQILKKFHLSIILFGKVVARL